MSYQDAKPVIVAAYFLLGIGAACVVIHFIALNNEDYTLPFEVFVLASAALHLVIAAGILLQKQWGLILFRGYLHVLYLGVPIGPYIAHKMLRYIDEHNIHQYFT